MPAFLPLVRIRIPELLTERGITPYRLSKLSDGRISLSTAYRLVRLRGCVKTFDAQLAETLCDLLHVEPGDLFERSDSARQG